MSFDILVTAPRFEAPGMALLEGAGCKVRLLSRDGAREEMEALLATHRLDGVISRFIPISGTAMARCASLRVISRAAAGYDIIDVKAATERGIVVTAAQGANAQSVAEFAIGLMLSLARDIPMHDAANKAGVWDRTRQGIELHGLTLGLVGLGRIARIVARIADAIGLRVLAWTPRIAAAGDIAPAEAAPSLEDMLARSDIVSLHAPLTEATRGMIGAAALARMKPGAMLVNTGRGGLVDEAALAAALRAGHLRGAALDVRAVEPSPAETVLTGVPNLILTPHMGAATTIARAATARVAARNLLDVLLGRKLEPGACLNPEVLLG